MQLDDGFFYIYICSVWKNHNEKVILERGSETRLEWSGLGIAA